MLYMSASKSAEGMRKCGCIDAGVWSQAAENFAGKNGMLTAFSGVTVAAIGTEGAAAKRTYARWQIDDLAVVRK